VHRTGERFAFDHTNQLERLVSHDLAGIEQTMWIAFAGSIVIECLVDIEKSKHSKTCAFSE